MAPDFPKLLVATEFAPNSPGGGPAVIRQMLKAWPAERLFWWSCFPDRDRHFGREVAVHRVARIPPKIYPHRRWCEQKSWLLENVWAPWAARHFQKTLDELNPGLVWVIPHVWSVLPMARALPRANLGFHVSIHDYADVQGNVTRFGSGRSRRMAALADRLYAGATTRDAICQPMIDDLQARTGREGTVARAGLEQEDFDYLVNKTEPATEAIRIAYAGTILVEKEFALFVQALVKIRPQLSRPVQLIFFGNHSYRGRDWFDSGWMQEQGNLPASALSSALKACSWGFAPMGLTDNDPRYNQFSLPTKFVSYLAAGLPIITLGHPQSTVVRMGKTYGVGCCVTSENLEVLSRELLTVLSTKNLWAKYGPEILRCAQRDFDMRRMRETLYEDLHKCAEPGRRGRILTA